MAMPVTDSVSPHRALQRKPAASFFYQGIVRSGINRRLSRKRCRLSIAGRKKRDGNGNNQFAHVSPLVLKTHG